MANQIPFSGAANNSGGYLIPDKQAGVLVNAILQEAGSLALAGDRRSTDARKEVFTIWLGQPTAGIVGEGAPKPVTGGELGTASLNIKKIASIVLFTDEQRDDVKNGDLDVLVDSGVREAIADVADANALGLDSGTAIVGAFDSELSSSTNTVELGTAADNLRLAVSAAMGKLEANGYRDPSKMAVLLPMDVGQKVRDARAVVETATPLYAGADADPFYGLERHYSSNLNTLSESAGAGKVVAIVAYKPNVHVRIRKDVSVDVSREATINDGSTDRHLFQENLTALRYETRLGFLVHDLNRAVAPIVNAS
jgi:hypothetical protein